jgi:hypothetical protein
MMAVILTKELSLPLPSDCEALDARIKQDLKAELSG